ncbi:hypothetical protein [Sulfurimonas sp.]|uniref:hypothetical protein n=1 Tax=Sulfurimonas sp. TaxID=2022749 RepID=UPI002B486D34|nr:hypothetical protein [Sulfurimonas sp.]
MKKLQLTILVLSILVLNGCINKKNIVQNNNKIKYYKYHQIRMHKNLIYDKKFKLLTGTIIQNKDLSFKVKDGLLINTKDDQMEIDFLNKEVVKYTTNMPNVKTLGKLNNKKLIYYYSEDKKRLTTTTLKFKNDEKIYYLKYKNIKKDELVIYENNSLTFFKLTDKDSKHPIASEHLTNVYLNRHIKYVNGFQEAFGINTIYNQLVESIRFEIKNDKTKVTEEECKKILGLETYNNLNTIYNDKSFAMKKCNKKQI